MFPVLEQSVFLSIDEEDDIWEFTMCETTNNELVVTSPRNEKLESVFHAGADAEFSYVIGENKFIFFTKIIKQSILGNVTLKLSKPENMSEITRIQMRRNFRVNVGAPIQLNGKNAKSINLSAGGMLCECNLELGLNLKLHQRRLISGSISLPSVNREIAPIHFQCQIIRVDLMLELKTYIVAVKFYEIEKTDLKTLTHYCYERQRELRLKE